MAAARRGGRPREWLARLPRDVYAITLICRDRRTPWYAKLIAACCVGYVFSPIQLIPDFVPVIGLLDDAVVVWLGVAFLVKLTPRPVLKDCRTRAAAGLGGGSKVPAAAWVAAAMALVVWLLLAVAGGVFILHVLHR